MSELCEECFVQIWLEPQEKQKLKEGKLKIILSENTDCCENCCKVTNIVESIWDKKSYDQEIRSCLNCGNRNSKCCGYCSVSHQLIDDNPSMWIAKSYIRR